MCGICGQVDPAGVQPDVIAAMMTALAHRGPDDEGMHVAGAVGLGNRRLSIIDVEGGRQPISNEDGSIWVVFNGEIYNHPALRRDLLAQGHAFATRSDTEVIVHLYEELGEGCVERLRGMFAFAVWDGRKGKLLLARDHLGQKPLFYAQQGEALLFASEIKGILAALGERPAMDLEAMHHYLSLRFVPSPLTMFQGIRKLPPAHVLLFQHGELKTRRYWDIDFRQKHHVSDADLLEGLRHHLTETISSHLISDVPVGAFLSGGMDSSMIVAIMARLTGEPVRTFAVGVEEQSFNELPYARQVAEHCGTAHVEARVQADLVKSLPEMIWHLDEPSDPIAACQYQAAALAAQHVKVVLGGDGGDELFAGFDRYLGVRQLDHYARIPGFLRRHVIGALLERLPEDFRYKSTTQKLRWAQQLSRLPTLAERYAEATCFFRFNHEQKRALYSEELWRQLGHINSADVIVDAYRAAQADDPVDRMLYADYHTRLPEHSLMLTDRMTMAHGLELRSPFLDHELVTYMAGFPSSAKIRGRDLKYVLRRVGTAYLPAAILARDKQGFMFPVAEWFRGELYSMLSETLFGSQFVKDGMFCRREIEALLAEHRRASIDNHVRLWMLFSLAHWYQNVHGPERL